MTAGAVRCIFVTGSAGGLGRAAAQTLLDDGHEVIVHARNAERLHAVKALVDRGASTVVGDLADVEQTRDVADQVNRLGPPDAVIHNAGVYSGPDIVPVNVVAPYLLTALIERPRRLVYLTSDMLSGGRADLTGVDWTGRRGSSPPTICGSVTSPRSGLRRATSRTRAPAADTGTTSGDARRLPPPLIPGSKPNCSPRWHATPARRWLDRSLRRVAAIHRKRDAEHQARSRAAQPQDRARDLLPATQAADRLVGHRVRDAELALLDHAGDHRRLDRPRAHRVDAHAARRVLQRRALRESDDTVLGGVIGRSAREPDQPAQRRAVDDRAAALLAHLVQLVLHTVPHAAEIDRVDALEVLGGLVRRVAGRDHDARVVERHVEPAERLDRALNQRGDLRLVGDVARDANRLLAGRRQLIRGCPNGVLVDVSKHDRRARGGKGASGVEPHAGAGTGHEGDLALEVVGGVHLVQLSADRGELRDPASTPPNRDSRACAQRALVWSAMTRTLILAAALTLTGCSSDKTPSSPSPTPSPSMTERPRATPSPDSNPQSDRVEGTVVRFTGHGTSVDVTIGADNVATRDFVSMLPLTLRLEEFSGREKISYLPRELDVDGAPGSDPEDGDLIYFVPWGNLGFYYNAEGVGHSDDTINIGTYTASEQQLRRLENQDVTVEVVE